jgi:S-adenosylmethionine decarboxylase
MKFRSVRCAGLHYLIDLNGVSPEILTNDDLIRHTLIEAAKDAGATVLGDFFHHFGRTEEYGVTGVIALSESHISIHTWPEIGYAAIDIFMCGNCDPVNSLPRIFEVFQPTTHEVKELARGIIK